MEEKFTIYTHDEFGRDLEFEIVDMKKFLESQENLSTLLDEIESKVAFQKDLKYGLEHDLIECSSKQQIEYLSIAIESNVRVIREIRTYLGLNPEPDIKPSVLTTEFRKAKARYN
jgi:hypothetical protein